MGSKRNYFQFVLFLFFWCFLSSFPTDVKLSENVFPWLPTGVVGVWKVHQSHYIINHTWPWICNFFLSPPPSLPGLLPLLPGPLPQGIWCSTHCTMYPGTPLEGWMPAWLGPGYSAGQKNVWTALAHGPKRRATPVEIASQFPCYV